MKTGTGHDSDAHRGTVYLQLVVRIAVVATLISLGAAQAYSLKDGEITAPLGTRKQLGALSGMIVYVNGQYTTANEARCDATVIAERVNSPVRLVYNDLTWHFVDWFSTAIEKVGDGDLSVNAATKTLIEYSRERIEQGDSIHLIGHSAGSLSILNAVRAIERGYRSKPTSERKTLLSRIHVLTIGGATFDEENLFADGWPAFLGSVHHLYDSRDGVPAVWGEGEFFDWLDCEMGDFHSITGHYVKYVTQSMLTSSGTTALKP